MLESEEKKMNDAKTSSKRKTSKTKGKKRNWPHTPNGDSRQAHGLGGVPYENIPAFKAAYDCYKECQFRFRNVPVDAKSLSREVKAKLMRVMVCITHARMNVKVLESLREATDLSMEVQITLRVLVEIHAITIKDFAQISQYSDSLVRQMVGWSNSKEYPDDMKESIENQQPIFFG